MTHLHLDFETASECDLLKRGLHPYAADPSTRVLMLGWAIDDEQPALWLPSQGKPPTRLMDALRDPSVQLIAHNAQFEQAIFQHVLKAKLAPSRWRDTMLMAYGCSLPGALSDLGAVIGLGDEQAKIAEGKALIRLFCVPRKNLTKKYPHRWATPEHYPDEWEKFCEYCIRDVVAEREIYKKLRPFDLPEHEWQMAVLDNEINRRGMPVDKLFVGNAIGMYQKAKAFNVRRLKGMTGLANPMSSAQMLEWAQFSGYPYGDMRKQTIEKYLSSDEDVDPALRQVLTLRLNTNKASLKKFDAIDRGVDDEGRLRYCYQFLGASRTGRWAGRRAQLQNLKRPSKAVEKQLEAVTQKVREGDAEWLDSNFGDLNDTLSSVVRSSFRAPEGSRLVVCDLSAIEDRVLAWLANCIKILDEHRAGLDPYKAFGTYLYGKAYDEITKEERTNSKPGRLGAGYRLGPGDYYKNKNGDTLKGGLWGYAESMGIALTQEECQKSVQAYRTAYPEIVQYWYALETAAEHCLNTRRPQKVGHITFDVKPPFLRIKLPSGRYLHYLRPQLRNKELKGRDGTPYTKVSLSYEGADPTTKKWTRIDTHGGKLAENVTQAVARDILAEGIQAADAEGFFVIGHVHDEIICEQFNGDTYHNVDLLAECMTRQLPWCPDLPLAAAGYEAQFYRKD